MRLPLDQNFPEPILEGLEPWMGDVQLVPLRTIDYRLTTLDDRELLNALKQLGYEGLVTLNYRMLRNPKELAAVLKTTLVIFAVEGVGDDPIRATGALLLDLQPAISAIRSGRFWRVLVATSGAEASRPVGAVQACGRQPRQGRGDAL